MEDWMVVEMLSEKFDRIVLDSARKRSSADKSSGFERAFENDDPNEEVDLGGKEFCSGKTEENGDSICRSSKENEKDQSLPDQGQTLPILRKILHLSTNIQDLKRGYFLLDDAVKDFRTNSYVNPECLEKLDSMANEYDRLKKKYLEESNKRKRLYNEVIELRGNIRVFCRCRPLNAEELKKGSLSAIEYETSKDNELQVTCSDSSKKYFRFDHVFKPEDSQDAVFAQTKPIITSVLDGYNVCIFAYGQTGTGKTFTMEGTQQDRGVNYRTLEELFRMSEERNGVMKYDLFVSMLEVYNEKIMDLLLENNDQATKKLEVKQAAEGTQEVPGLVESHVFGTQEVWEILKRGSRARSVGSTSANELSSRSHCLLRVTVKGENLINGQRTRSHLWMVDLAGSERVGRIEAEGERLKESQFINKSLSALGDVIAALASKSPHIPYRNSKLTHMLQSSLGELSLGKTMILLETLKDFPQNAILLKLSSKKCHHSAGGDCKTLMFVQISPHPSDAGETLCSLNFASRVRGIESGPARKQADMSELLKYKQMVETLKHDDKESRKLQENMLSLQLRLAAREHTCRTLQEKVWYLENQLVEERKTRLKQESRALNVVAAAAQPSKLSYKPPPPPKMMVDKKPPLGPSGTRMPLRRITNFLPPPTPSQKLSMPACFKGTNPASCKENISKTNAPSSRPRMSMQPRQISIAVGNNATPSTGRLIQPKRRVSIATFHLEPSSQMMTPLASSRARTRISGGGLRGRQSFFQQDPRKARYSRLFSPAPRASSDVMRTPISMNSSGKFRGSPMAVQGSWKSKHPMVMALQRRSLVWSPLKLKTMRISSQKPLPSMMISSLPSEAQ